MTGLETKTYYELLGVPFDASKQQIRVAYRKIANRYHPDSVSNPEYPSAEELDQVKIFTILTRAYRTLTDDEKRNAYDMSLPHRLKKWEEKEPDWVMHSSDVSIDSSSGKSSGSRLVFGALDEKYESAFDRAFQEPKAIAELIKRKGIFTRLLELLGIR